MIKIKGYGGNSMDTIRTLEGRILTEQEKEMFLAWLAMYPAIMEIKAEPEQKGELPHEN